MNFFDTDPAMQAAGARMAERVAELYRSRGVPTAQFGYVLLWREAHDARPRGTALRADWRCYPCSLVKVFQLVVCLDALDRAVLVDHEDLDIAMRDMIVWSSNTATNYVIDLVTGTTGDTLLDAPAMAAFRDRRQAFNRYFEALGWPELRGINVLQKLMDDRRYGRERALLGADGAHHNVLTPMAMARLMHAVFRGELLSPQRQALLRQHLQRDTASPERRHAAYQIDGYLGAGLPAGVPMWSKAGRTTWTGDAKASHYRHDSVHCLLPQAGSNARAELDLTVMSHGEPIAGDDAFLPNVARWTLEALAEECVWRPTGDRG